MALYTLKFNNYEQAKQVATILGFWNIELDKLKSRGRTIGTDGEYYGWGIDDIGQDPIITPSKYNNNGVIISSPVKALGYYVNISGEMPTPPDGYPDPSVFIVPYGSGGRLFPNTISEV